MRKTRVAVYEVPAHMKCEALATYFKQFDKSSSVSSDVKLGKWSFDIMHCRWVFDDIPSMLDIGGRMLLIIVTGRRQTC